MSLIWSNVLALASASALVIVGKRWVAPRLNSSTRRFFLVLLPSGLVFVAGQFSQADEWGPMWMQYHLLDVAFQPWGTALTMCCVYLLARKLRRRVRERRLVRLSFVAVLLGGYATEVWDTCLTAYDPRVSIWEAVDVGDYVALTLGAALTVGVYALCRRAVTQELVS